MSNKEQSCMKELSLHILDIAQNSLNAGAKNIGIVIVENTFTNIFSITITDDGKGMAPDVLQKVTDPYFTSRKTRKVGLGLSLYRQNAELAGGGITIASEEGRGTIVSATFIHDHLDRPPLGDIAGVIMILVIANPSVEFVYSHTKNGAKYEFDTLTIKEVLDTEILIEPRIGKYLKEMIKENLNEIGVT